MQRGSGYRDSDIAVEDQVARSGAADFDLPLRLDCRACPDGEIGRRSGLKIRGPQGRGGSSPPPGTM